MSNQIELTSKYIKALSPLAVASDKAIGEHFVKKFEAMYRVPHERAIAFYEREKDNFNQRIAESEELQKCTPLSLFTAFMKVGGWKLSLDGGSQSEVYLIPGNRKIVVNGQDQWIKECVAQPSPYGEKKIRVENGTIAHVGNPTVVYDCDSYKEFDTEEGVRWVKWEKGVRSETSKITNGFILLEYPDGRREYKTFDLDDVKAWEEASKKKNKGHANALYGYEVTYEGNKKVSTKVGHIDKKFFEGKILKHAFKLMPRVISDSKLPTDFVPTQEFAERQGFDVSEFTEDIDHEEVSNETPQDDFDAAIEEASKVEKAETATVENAFDEPEF